MQETCMYSVLISETILVFNMGTRTLDVEIFDGGEDFSI